METVMLFAPPSSSAAEPNFIFQLVPILILQVPFAIFNYHAANKMGRNGVLYAIITMIPIFGMWFSFFVFCSTLLFVMDKVKDIGK